MRWQTVCPPIAVTVCCENVLELGDLFLQLLGFSGVQVSSGAGYHTFSSSQNPWVLWDWGIELSIGAAHATGSQGPRVVLLADTRSRLLTLTILTVTFRWAWTSVLAVYRPSWREVFKLCSLGLQEASLSCSYHPLTLRRYHLVAGQSNAGQWWSCSGTP